MDLNKRLHEHTGLTPTDQCLRDYFLRYPERAARGIIFCAIRSAPPA